MGSKATRRGRPRLTLDALVRKDMSILSLNEHVALYRAQWKKKRIHIADPIDWDIRLVWFGYWT